MSEKKLYGLQALRGVAAVLVVLHHVMWFIGVFGSTSNSLGGQASFEFGAVGVDIFFVLSGFVMVYVAKPGSTLKDAKNFFLNRVARIVPLYWIFTVLMFFLLSIFSKNHQPGFDSLIKSLFFVPYLDGFSGSTHPVVDQGWTLNYEMGFYAIFSILVWLPNFVRNSLFFLVCLLLVSRAGSGVVANFWANPIIFEFLLGMLLASVININVKFLSVNPLIVMLWGVFLMFMFGNFEFGNYYRLAIWGGGSLLLVCSVLQLENMAFAHPVLRNRFLQVIGDASYSIYLAHGFVTIFGGFAIKKVSVWHVGLLVDVIFFLFGVIVSILLGVFVHYKVERPINSFVKQRLLYRSALGLS